MKDSNATPLLVIQLSILFLNILNIGGENKKTLDFPQYTQMFFFSFIFLILSGVTFILNLKKFHWERNYLKINVQFSYVFPRCS